MKLPRNPSFYLLASIVVLWVLFVFFASYTPAPPITYDHNGSVEPKQVRAGDSVIVYRTFTITRKQRVTIHRRMVNGDCAKACDVIDMQSSQYAALPGTYTLQKRNLYIPKGAHPGMWRLEFSLQWDDFLGRSHSSRIPSLDIVVIP